ncbi:hypothetical protein C8A03DRAFT_14495 [Achaetomium macrosporum]|uniref:Transcription factor RfeG n=1 Tax=Achaetomium macrosporum TaxID=79813 RepID=A0AAN7CBP0_9PEZI|nr:hypothetical protein C8A03DRAFT_14495 [Achaetomium macrosporum]
MAGRPNNRSSQTQPMPPAAPRQNEYFVPRDGIDREVITSDICRYLGNDALVRPGTYESPDGRVTQGYFITAYRNLTSAMIQDLKADSARWEQERRAAARSSGGGTMHSSQPNGMFVKRNSNSPVGSRDQPRGQSDYSAWKNLQREQQEYEATYGSAMDIDYAPPPGAAGNSVYASQPYAGAPPASYPPAAYPPPVHAAAPSQYPAQPAYGYPPNPPPTQYSPQPQNPGDRYSAIPPPPVPGSYQDTAFVHGSNYQTSAPGYATSGPARMPPAMPHTSAAPSRTFSAPPVSTPVYGTEPDPYGYPPAGNPAAQAFPTDALYGRGTTQRQGYPAAPEPQYDDIRNPGLQSATTPTSVAPAQTASSVAPPARRERDRDSEPRERERERDHRDHKTRRSEQERDDRHADRNRHRHR